MAEAQQIPFWDDITSSERFQAMPVAERSKVRDAYFTEFIAPQVTPQLRAVTKKEWEDRTDPLDPGVWSDIKHTFNIGFQGIALDARAVTEKVFGKGFVAAVDSVDEWFSGKPSEQLLKDNIARSQQKLTPQMRDALQKEWIDDETGGPGAAFSDPRAYLGNLMLSLPGTVATMGPALTIARGLYVSQIAAKVAPELAAARAATAAQLAGGLTEGLQAAGQTSREVNDAILRLTPEQLQGSEVMKMLMDSGMSFEDARRTIAEDASTKAMILSGVATSIFGGMGDRVLSRTVTRGLSGGLGLRVVKAASAEGGLEEAPQSYLQQVAHNIGLQLAQPETPITKGAASAAVGGMVVGGMMGGAVGVVGKARPEEVAKPKPDTVAAARLDAAPTVDATIQAAEDFVAAPFEVGEEAAKVAAEGLPIVGQPVAGLLPAPALRVTPEGAVGTTSELQQAAAAAEAESQRVGLTQDVRRAQAQRYGTEPTAMMLAFEEAQRKQQEAERDRQDIAGAPSEVGARQEPVQTQPLGTAGTTAAAAGGILQTQVQRPGAKPDVAVRAMAAETEAALERAKGPEILRTVTGAREDTSRATAATRRAQGAPPAPSIGGVPVEQLTQQDLDAAARTGTQEVKNIALAETKKRKATTEAKFVREPEFNETGLLKMSTIFRSEDMSGISSTTEKEVQSGKKPPVMELKPSQVLATQADVAMEGGGDTVIGGLEDHPVVVRLSDGTYHILDGHHRFNKAAAKDASVKAYVIEAPAAFKTEPRYARAAAPAKKMAVQAVQATLQKSIDSVNIPVTIFATTRELSDAFGIRAPIDTKGVHLHGKIGIVAENANDELDVQRTFWHEGFHGGLEKIAPATSAKYEAELERVAARNENVRDAAREWRKTYGENFKAKLQARGGFTDAEIGRKTRLLSFEEALADLSSENATIAGLSRFVAALQQTLRALGLDTLADWMEGKTDAEALQLVRHARDAISGTQPSIVLTSAGAAVGEPQMARGANDPDIQYRRGMETVQDLLTTDRTLNRVISRVNTPYHIAKTHPIFRPVYDRAQAFYADISRIALGAADLAQDLLPRIESFADFKKRTPSTADVEAISRALYAGTLYGGGSPMEGVVWSNAELRGTEASIARPLPTELREHPLNDKQIGLYRQALASVNYSLEEHSKSLVMRMASRQEIALDKEMSFADVAQLARDAATQKMEDLRIQLSAADITEANTTSLNRQLTELQAFQASVTDIEAKTQALIDHGYFPAMRFGEYFVYVKRGDEQLHFGLYETQSAANEAKRELRSQHPDAEVTSGTMNKEAYRLFNGLSLDAMEVFADHIQNVMGEEVELDPIMQEWFRLATAERSVYKRQLHRKGVPGYSDDIPRVLAAFTVSSARSAAGHYHTSAMLQAVRDIEEGDLQAYATRYVTYMKDPQEEAQFVRGILANYYLLGSIAFGAINLTQPLMVTIPALTQHTGYVDAARHVVAAAKDVVAGHAKLQGEEKTAFDRAIKDGIVAPQELHQIRAESQASMFGKDLGWRKLAFGWGAIYSLTEQFNRGTSFLAAFRLATEKGMADPYEFAKEIVADTQFTYNRANRPELSRGTLGSIILTFKQFSISYVELATRLYRSDKKAFALMMLTLFAMAGGEGLPFAEDAEDLIDTIGQKLGFATNARKTLRHMATEILGRDAAQILLHGVTSIPGIPLDIANRIGMHNLLPGTAMLKTSEPDKARDIVQILGPAASLFDRVVLKQDELALLPKAIQDAWKAKEMLMTGMYLDSKNRRIIDVTPTDAALKLVGFQPASVVRESRIINENQQDIALQKVMEDSIVSEWAEGIFEKDAAKVQAARETQRDWNEDNPHLQVRIRAGQVQRRVKEMKRTREERFVRSAAPEIRRGIREELRP